MKSFYELKEALTNNKTLIWNDPDPIKGNNYKITFIEDISDFDEYDDIDSPILIQYNKGKSEAQVYLHEIILL